MVKDVKEIDPEFHAKAFGQHRLLVDGEVPFLVGRTTQRVAAHVAVVASSDNAVRSRSRGHSADGAGDRKRTEIEIIERITLVVNDRTNHIGPIKTISATTEIIPE